jgi:hypothetical protein
VHCGHPHTATQRIRLDVPHLKYERLRTSRTISSPRGISPARHAAACPGSALAESLSQKLNPLRSLLAKNVASDATACLPLPTTSLSLLLSTPGITSSEPTSNVSSDAPSKYPPPSQPPPPQPRHQVPSPSPPPSNSSHVPHLQVQVQHYQPISQTTTSLSTSPLLYTRFLTALTASPAILGSGRSRLLVYKTKHTPRSKHHLAKTFRAPAALLFNSRFFACVPQPGDVLLYDTAINASVHDGARASHVAPRFRHPFVHNNVRALRAAL